MNGFDNFINGMLTGLGMWLMMTVLGILSFLALKKQFTKWVAKIWADIKREGIKLDGTTVDMKIKAQKKKNKK